jgi:hypothetical protein
MVQIRLSHAGLTCLIARKDASYAGTTVRQITSFETYQSALVHDLRERVRPLESGKI